MKSFWENKHVLVTGATGFIGSSMVRMLLSKGAVVTGITSLRTKETISTENLRYIQCDLMNFKSCLKAFSNQDAVLHFAAFDGGAAFKKEHSSEILQANTQMVSNVLEASKRVRVKRILIISSVEVYASDARSPIHESSALVDGSSIGEFGYRWSKRFSEILSEIYVRQYGLQVAVARLGNVYGPGDDIKKQRVIPTFIHRLENNHPIEIYGGQKKIAYLYVDDATRSLLDLLEIYPIGEPINIVGEHSVTLIRLADMIGSILGRKPIVHANEGQEFKSRSFDVTRAKKLFNFHEKVSLKTGLEESVAYYTGKR